jgi:hypothetical protein
MEYNVYSHDTGKEKVPKTPLVNTNEKVHASVRLRLGIPGKGLEDRGEYAPGALDGWKVVGVANVPVGPVTLPQIQVGQKKIYWQKEGRTMEEEVMSELEWDLLKTGTPDLQEKFLSTVPRSVFQSRLNNSTFANSPYLGLTVSLLSFIRLKTSSLEEGTMSIGLL